MPKRVLIIGGGVIGLCTAYYAMRAGHAVTVLERGPETRDMASLGNAGMIVPSHFVPLATPANVKYGLRNVLNPESPFYIRPRADKALIAWGMAFLRAANAGQIAKAEPLLRDLNTTSRALFEKLADERENDFGLVKKGLLMLCATQHGFDEEAAFAAHARELGVPAEVLTPERTRALEPGVTLDIAGAVHFPNDCHLSPARFISGMAALLKREGVDIRYGRAFSNWTLRNGSVTGVESINQELSGAQANPHDTQTHEADAYVIAGGVWSDEATALLGVSLPLQGGKGYSLTLSAPRQKASICSILVEARAAVTPMGDTLRVGGTMEIAGKDASINPRRVRGIVKSFVRYYSAFTPQDFEKVTPWRGLRPVSPDGLPYIGRLRTQPNVIVAAGHAMMGLSLGPVTGTVGRRYSGRPCTGRVRHGNVEPGAVRLT